MIFSLFLFISCGLTCTNIFGIILESWMVVYILYHTIAAKTKTTTTNDDKIIIKMKIIIIQTTAIIFSSACKRHWSRKTEYNRGSGLSTICLVYIFNIFAFAFSRFDVVTSGTKYYIYARHITWKHIFSSMRSCGLIILIVIKMDRL